MSEATEAALELVDRPRHLVIVSYYDRRPIEPLHRLFASFGRHPAGLPFDLALVVNRTGDHPLDLPAHPHARVLTRANHGMNIGAWDHGWRELPGYDGYLFLQDECYVVRDDWLAAFAGAATHGTGLVGESENAGWARPWDELRDTHAQANLPEHLLDGNAANRIDVYRDFMRRHGIDPGADGRHLRSLVWYMPAPVLKRIDGFPIGGNFGECIGAEIGVCRKVVAAGLSIAQVAPLPFHFIRHFEWNQDHPGGPYVHGRPRARTTLTAFSRAQGAGLARRISNRARWWVRRALGRHSPW